MNIATIVMAHANTDYRKTLLKNCLKSITTPIILSTNFPVSADIQLLCDHVIYTKDNPIVHKEDYARLNIAYYYWYINQQDEKVYEDMEFEHAYAVYCLTRNGIEYGKLKGYDALHCINYDYEISEETIEHHNELLNDNDIIVYSYDDSETMDYDGQSYSTGFYSGKIHALESFFMRFNTIEEYYFSESKYNVLERKIYLHYDGIPSVKSLDFNFLKLTDKVNQEGVLMFSQSTQDSNLFGQLGLASGTDKISYHRYDKIYPFYIDKYKDQEISLFEIGYENGNSFRVWKEYFPKATIYSMDIDQFLNDGKHKVFKGDQSNIHDLQRITEEIGSCSIIIDDGSHIAEHQLKSFYYLFKNLLAYGGTYIIEDIECSYWKPESDIYQYQSGYINIVDYFTKLNHALNGHYNLQDNNLDIKTITFGANCIIITKKEECDLGHTPYRFTNKL